MLEEYLKRLENLIVPNYYDKNNFKEKIKAEFEDPAELEEKKKISMTNEELLSKIQNEEDKKLLEEYIQKMGVKDGNEESKNLSSENRVKIYEKILENEGNLENALNNYSSVEHPVRMNTASTKSNKTYSLSPSRRMRMSTHNLDEGSLRQKVHVLNIKNMNYRYELETLKSKMEEMNKKIEDQQVEIERLEKQKESSNKYLIKLEAMVSAPGNEKVSFTSSNTVRSNNSSKIFSPKNASFSRTAKAKSDNLLVDFNKMNKLVIEDRVNNSKLSFNDKGELKDFVFNLMNENQKLKAFQSQVFEVSKNYDDINENMIESMKQVQKVLNSNQPNDSTDKQEMALNLAKVIENVEKTLEMKQGEYGFLIDYKDQQIKFLQEEVNKVNGNLEIVRRDRIRDQKMMNDYETEINFLSSRVQESPSSKLNNESRLKELNQSLKLEKKIAPAKNIVNKIVKKFERTFDLQDKTNVKMISSITQNIK